MSNKEGTSSTPHPDGANDTKNSIFWPNVSFTLVRPSQGKYSPRTDERCLTYCSQSVSGRMEKEEPWCRSICIRRVFAHEVRKAVTQDNHNKRNQTVQEKYPLPPEGQRADEVPGGTSEVDRYDRKLRENGAKHWEEGWYLWYSKSRWAAQEKLDLMMHDLPVQANWYRHMAKQKADWDRERNTHDIGWDPPSMSITAPRQPFSDPSKQSSLIRFRPPHPSHLPFFNLIQAHLLEPVGKTVSIVRANIESGAQKQFVELFWQNAKDKELYVRAWDRVVRLWGAWKKS